MDVPSALLDVLIVLVAAKAAAELAERVGIPAVVGEIIAGVLVGPSVLGWIGGGEILALLAEIGVILLLFEVGLEMELAELGKVGRAAMAVAVVGVVVPMAAGGGVALVLGMTGLEALFVGAALTATSVGITARVFGDLRALAMVEARTVLGAAVADDILGLLILTVVVRVAESGSVAVGEVGGVLAVAVLFLVVSVVAGLRLVPPLFALLARHSRSPGTLVALALAFILAISEIAHAAGLAPIIGAFVAGLCLARASTATRIRRELTPVGHLFIPVFFLQIGVEADVSSFARANVLGIAAVLLLVAVAGKLVAAVAMGSAPGDRLLVGIGMVPRGEVGLIFATIGRQQGVFDDDIFAALLLVVLVTTLATPPALRWRLLRMAGGPVSGTSPPESASAEQRPEGGWLLTDGEMVELAARPPAQEALAVALEAAIRAEHEPVGEQLLAWLTSWPDEDVSWTAESRARLVDLLEHGGPRSWRLLHVSGVLSRALPQLDTAITRQASDPFALDPTAHLRFPRLAHLCADPVSREAVGETWWPRLLLAALVLDASEGSGDDPLDLARSVSNRIGLEGPSAEAMCRLVGDHDLLIAGARHVRGFEEGAVMQIAVHLGSVEVVRALHALSLTADLEPAEQSAVATVVDLVISTLAQPELSGPAVTDAIDRRRQAARLFTEAVNDSVHERLASAPRAYVLARAPIELARDARRCEPPPSGSELRVFTDETSDPDEWWVELIARDRLGLLAHTTEVLADAGCDVIDAVVATWPDGLTLSSMRVRAFSPPNSSDLETALHRAMQEPLDTRPAPGLDVTFDDAASPWHTLCMVRAEDRFGLLSTVATAFTAAGASVHFARITTNEGTAVNHFELTSGGRKLSAQAKDDICAALAGGVIGRRRRLGRGWELAVR